MNNQTKDTAINEAYQIMSLVLSENQCHKFVRIIKTEEVGGIILIGRGTVDSDILNLLGIKNQKREVINILLKKDKAQELMDLVTVEFQLDKPGHGIAYTTPVVTAEQILENKQGAWNSLQSTEGESMYKKLTVIVNRGMAEDVMEIARKSGVTGGTILHGRGAGPDFAAKFLGMEIEPEKELVIILMQGDLIDKVVSDLYAELKMDVPGNGILFVEPVLDVRGIKPIGGKSQ